MTPLEPAPPTPEQPALTELEQLRLVNTTKLNEFAAAGIQVNLTAHLIEKLMDRLIGHTGSPERDAFDLAWETDVVAHLAEIDRAVTEQRARALLLQPGPVPPPNGMHR